MPIDSFQIVLDTTLNAIDTVFVKNMQEDVSSWIPIIIPSVIAVFTVIASFYFSQLSWRINLDKEQSYAWREEILKKEHLFRLILRDLTSFSQAIKKVLDDYGNKIKSENLREHFQDHELEELFTPRQLSAYGPKRLNLKLSAILFREALTNLLVFGPSTFVEVANANINTLHLPSSSKQKLTNYLNLIPATHKQVAVLLQSVNFLTWNPYTPHSEDEIQGFLKSLKVKKGLIDFTIEYLNAYLSKVDIPSLESMSLKELKKHRGRVPYGSPYAEFDESRLPDTDYIYEDPPPSESNDISS